MDQALLNRLMDFVSSVYDMEPLDEAGGETPLGWEAFELLGLLSEAGAGMPSNCQPVDEDDHPSDRMNWKNGV